jgi:two-component system LytT family sensor kinase
LPNSSKYSPLFSKPWIYHPLFWLSYYIFAALISLSIHQIYDTRFYWELLSLLPPDMLLVYTNLYLLIPVLLLKRRFVLYFGALLVCISLEAALNIFLHRFYAQAGSVIYSAVSNFNTRNFSVQSLNSIYLLGLTTAAKFLKDWMSQQQLLREKERQQKDTELNFLKSQIHPHFFFNTLNNLYALTLQKSDLAPEVVVKLSDLMSYMLYESGAPLVPLDKELSNLENYIALEKLRFGRRLTVCFEKEGLPSPSLSGQSDPARNVRIPPLILLTFVENSFKHGMKHTTEEGTIAISLKVQPDQLWFSIGNPVTSPPATPIPGSLSAASPGGSPAGLGLKNVVRRLDLLYGDRYRLDLAGTDDHFHVTLKIPLP